MENRLIKLPLRIQKRLYELTGNAGTICHYPKSRRNNPQRLDRGEQNQVHEKAFNAYMFTTDEELEDFLIHARHNLEHRISWHDVMQEYNRRPEWRLSLIHI